MILQLLIAEDRLLLQSGDDHTHGLQFLEAVPNRFHAAAEVILLYQFGICFNEPIYIFSHVLVGMAYVFANFIIHPANFTAQVIERGIEVLANGQDNQGADAQQGAAEDFPKRRNALFAIFRLFIIFFRNGIAQDFRNIDRIIANLLRIALLVTLF